MKRIATVVAVGALALVAGSLVMLEASDQANAAVRGGGHGFGGGGRSFGGGGRSMMRSNVRVSPGGIKATPHFGSTTTLLHHRPPRGASSLPINQRVGAAGRLRGDAGGAHPIGHRGAPAAEPRRASLPPNPCRRMACRQVRSTPGLGSRKGPGGIKAGPGNQRSTTLAPPFLATPDSLHFAGFPPGHVGPQPGCPTCRPGQGGPKTGQSGTGSAGHPPSGQPARGNITIINNKFVTVFRGPRQIWRAGAWASLAAPAAIPAVYVGGLQYDPYGYVALAKPVCSGVTPEGYRLTWRGVPTDTGVVIPQCVAYYPRGRAAPVVAAGAVPASAMAQGCLVEIYSQVAFTGTSSDVAADQPRLSDYGWDKQISSLNVKSGTWDFYTEPDYGGLMVQLPPGQYPNLDELDKQISSFMCTQEQ
jgi:hypothetical protein